MKFTEKIKGKVDDYKQKTVNTANKTLDAFFNALVVSLVFITLLWFSVFFYVLFYHAYVPAMEHAKPVYLEYDSCGDAKKGICSFPSAHIQLTKSNSILMVGQPYSVKLILEMPESPANKDLGMFMVCGRLQSKDGTTVSNACKSAMIKYSSPLVRIMSVLSFAPLFIFGRFEEKQTVVTELYAAFEEDQSYPVTDVYITVQSFFAEIYSAKLILTAEMSGLRYFMYNWPVVSALLGISFIVIIILFIVTLSWWQLYGPYRQYGSKLVYTGIQSLTPPQSSSESDDDEDTLGVEELPDETPIFEEIAKRLPPTEIPEGETSKSEEGFITELKTLDESSDV